MNSNIFAFVETINDDMEISKWNLNVEIVRYMLSGLKARRAFPRQYSQ